MGNLRRHRRIFEGRGCVPYFLRGCAGTSDRRERKSHAEDVFGWTRSERSGAWGNPNQCFRNIQKDIPKTLLAYVSFLPISPDEPIL